MAMVACLLGCDALFERGLIAVDAGLVRVSSASKDYERLSAHIQEIGSEVIPAWNMGRAPYFEWHLANQYQAMP